MKRIMMFDLDGTVTAQESLPLIAAALGIDEGISALTAKTVRGDISFVEGFITRVNILKAYPVSRIAKIVENISLHEPVANYIKENRRNCLIVTGNLDCWVERLLARLDCDYVASTSLCSNDRVKQVLHIVNKADVVRKYQNEGFCVTFVGEGDNDAEAIRIADIGIAFGKVHRPSPLVIQFASHVIFDDVELCQFLRQLSP